MAFHAGLKHQFAGLGDEHEIAHDIGMGDGDGAAGLDLLFKDGNDAAVAAQDVAETGGDELGLAFHLAVFLGLVEALDIDFADTFAAAHHIGGIHGLVGGNHHEFPDSVLHRHVGHHLCRIHIVQHCLGGVVLHHGHVLVGRGMENVVGFEATEVEVHAGTVADRGDNGLHLDIRVILGHLQTHVVLRGFSLVDEHHGLRSEGRDLTHYLAAYRTGGAGDEDAAPLDFEGKGVEIHLHLLTGQEVLDMDFTELRRVVGLGVPFGYVRCHVNLRPGRDYAVLQFLITAEIVVAQRRYEHRGYLVLAEDVREVRIRLIDLHAHEMGIVKFRVVRDEALDHITGRLFAVDALGYCYTALLDTIDKGTGGGVGLIGGVVEIFHKYPDKEHACHEACPCHHYLHGTGIGQDMVGGHIGKEMQTDGRHRSANHSINYLQQVHERRVAHHHRIGVEQLEEQQLWDKENGQDQQQRAESVESIVKTDEKAVCDNPDEVIEKAVHQDYDPIRSSLFGKVPV